MRGDPTAQLRTLTAAIRGHEPDVVISNLETVREQVERRHALTGARTLFLGLMAALAFVLAVIGVFGLTSFTAEVRARESGIRIALGASPLRVAATIVSEVWWMGCLGVGLGWLASTWAATVLSSYFTDPLPGCPSVVLAIATTMIAAATLVVITALGTLQPLRRVVRMSNANVIDVCHVTRYIVP